MLDGILVLIAWPDFRSSKQVHPYLIIIILLHRERYAVPFISGLLSDIVSDGNGHARRAAPANARPFVKIQCPFYPGTKIIKCPGPQN